MFGERLEPDFKRNWRERTMSLAAMAGAVAGVVIAPLVEEKATTCRARSGGEEEGS